MLTITVVRAVIGLALFGMKGLIAALGSQAIGMEISDRALERRDHRRYVDGGGWPGRHDFPVVGASGWKDQVNAMAKEQVPWYYSSDAKRGVA